MKLDSAIETLAGLAQPTRLEAFRLLVRQEPCGLPAGEIAKRLAVPQNTMSSHLGILARAGLVTVERRSRTMIYRVHIGTIRSLVVFLLRDCCGGQSELCTPLLDNILINCHQPENSCGRAPHNSAGK